MRERWTSVAATGAVAVVVGLVMALVAWASAVGSDDLLTGGPGARVGSETPSPSSSGPSGVVGSSATFDPADHPWLTTLLVIVLLMLSLGVLVALVLLARGVWLLAADWWVRRREAPRRLEADVEVLVPPEQKLVRVVTAQADRQRADLAAGGSPRNAIVECWHRFEELGAEAGLERHPWETSSEFTLRILDLADADGVAAARLGGLYREARFSEHPLGEDARTAALVALEAVHESLRTRALFRAGGVS